MIRDEILKWQLLMHPYPTAVKRKALEERSQTPTQLKRCVRAIVKKNKGKVTREIVSRAFAICTKSLQSKGYFKKGTHEPTKKGKKRGRSKAAEKGHVEKLMDYETMLAIARGEK